MQAGVIESEFCASTMSAGEAGDWAKPKSDPERLWCTLEYIENIAGRQQLIDYSHELY